MKQYLICLVALLFVTCSVQKRKYQKGYYITWKGHSTELSKPDNAVVKNNSHAKTNAYQLAELQQPVDEIKKETQQVSEIQTTANNFKQVKSNLPGDSCDVILFTDGSEIRGKVQEINPTEIKYKKCSMPGGPLYALRKTDVFMITFSNGTKQTFNTGKSENKNTYLENQPGNKYSGSKNEDYGIYSLVCGIAGLFIGIGSIAAIVLGSIALRRIRRDPNKYGGAGMAKAGIALGILKLVLIAFIFVLLLALL